MFRMKEKSFLTLKNSKGLAKSDQLKTVFLKTDLFLNASVLYGYCRSKICYFFQYNLSIYMFQTLQHRIANCFQRGGWKFCRKDILSPKFRRIFK